MLPRIRGFDHPVPSRLTTEKVVRRSSQKILGFGLNSLNIVLNVAFQERFGGFACELTNQWSEVTSFLALHTAIEYHSTEALT